MYTNTSIYTMYGNEVKWKMVQDRIADGNGYNGYADGNQWISMARRECFSWERVHTINHLIGDIFVPLEVDEIKLHVNGIFCNKNLYDYSSFIQMDTCVPDPSMEEILEQCNDVENRVPLDIPEQEGCNLLVSPKYIKRKNIVYKRARLFDPPASFGNIMINLYSNGQLHKYQSICYIEQYKVITHDDTINEDVYTKLPNGDELEMIDGVLYQI